MESRVGSSDEPRDPQPPASAPLSPLQSSGHSVHAVPLEPAGALSQPPASARPSLSSSLVQFLPTQSTSDPSDPSGSIQGPRGPRSASPRWSGGAN